MAQDNISPMMGRYLETKEEYPDCILFYRLGDFYEMFFDDAIVASRELEIALTGKSCGLKQRAPMCGVPFHSASGYIEKLVQRGYKVAICEQIQDPKKVKGLVDRAVVRVITPGTVMEENMLDDKKNNYLSVVVKTNEYSLSFCDISTGEVFTTTAAKKEDVLNEIARYLPKELVVSIDIKDEMTELLENRIPLNIEAYPIDFFEEKELVMMQFKEKDIKKLKDSNFLSLAGMIQYLIKTQKRSVEFIDELTVYDIKDYMEIDIFTRRSLEVCETMRDRSKKGSLLGVLDKTNTSMGARRLKQWIEKPLVNLAQINKRLEAVGEFKENTMLRQDLAHTLEGIYDMSRISSRVSLGNTIPKDMLSLKESLANLPEVKYLLNTTKSELLRGLYDNLDIMNDLHSLLEIAIDNKPSALLKDGKVIKEGYSKELDRQRDILKNAKFYIKQEEEKERERTGIKTLKISSNKVFGYYIEVTKNNTQNIPDDYIRKQTLANCERYISPHLKELEEEILNASEMQLKIETELFNEVSDKVLAACDRIKNTCNIIAVCDAIVSLAEVAAKNNYVCPEISTDGELIIKDSRHPVVEKMQRKSLFVPNDVKMDTDKNRLLIITGPNMAGKSTYMRQTALICLMAQAGSFVPASYAKISVTDRIFTRVGASDDIAQGHSTFMLEMTEVANILNNASEKSLIILDEIGRGTSTYDGLAIAWAVAEYVLDKEKIGAKTLFATHYHELCTIEDNNDGVKNYSVAVKKRGDDITFLRKIVPGGTDDSFGIEVAALAGVPKEVVSRAKEVLRAIENDEVIQKREPKQEDLDTQVNFTDVEKSELVHTLAQIDASTYTPIEALNKLYELSLRASNLDS